MLPLHLNINQVENMYQQGLASDQEVIDYLRKWNKGPHFNQAVLRDGAIRLFDPEKSGVFYKHLKDEFGLRL